MPGFFSDTFGISTDALDDYGAVDVSLIADLPLFVDPFLLFNSEKPEYQALHNKIVEYLIFLKRKSEAEGISDGLLKEWYCFSEIRQNWLGYCELGNKGSGLGIDFARALHKNLRIILSDFGSEKVTRGTHLEKVCLIKDGVGRDNVSDFATSLIKEYLLQYTQTFALSYLREEQRKSKTVERVRFNRELESWVSVRYVLPHFDGDYVMLTPRDMLTKDENWINQKDLIDKFEDVPKAVPNSQLRTAVANYFYKRLQRDDGGEPTAKERRKASLDTLAEYPWLVDFYIKLKEESGNEATSVSEEKLVFAQLIFNDAVRQISAMLPQEFYSSPPQGTYEEAHERLAYLIHVIEDQG